MNAFAAFPQIERVVIFGSRAKGNFRQGSDIDLAIFGKDCSPGIAMDLHSKLNENTPIPYFVDVVDYNSLQQPGLKEHINRVGKVMYVASEVRKNG